jgi:hypothetical protein
VDVVANERAQDRRFTLAQLGLTGHRSSVWLALSRSEC